MTDDHVQVPLKEIERKGDYMIFTLDTSGTGYSFRAGKSATISIPSRNGGDFDLKRIFSIASPPARENYMRFATIYREESDFKRRLSAMKPGDIVDVAPPTGGFFLVSDREKPLVFITSGIGITPVISVMHDAADQGRTQKITLIYVNSSESRELFLDELRQLEASVSGFSISRYMVGDTTGDLGKAISGRELRKYAGSKLSDALYYVSGEPRFVYEARKILVGLGIGTASLKTEKFAGY